MPTRPPKPTDLTTIDDVKLVLRKSLTDNRQDDLVQLYVSAFSRVVQKYIERQLCPAEDGVTKVYAYDGSGYLDLAPWEARSIASVTIDGLALPIYDPAAPTVQSYRPQPEQKTTEGTILSLQLPRRDYYDCRREDGHVSIVGDFGVGETADVPEDIAIATAMAVADAIRNPEGAAARSLGDLSLTEETSPFAQSLPGPARAMLAPYMRR